MSNFVVCRDEIKNGFIDLTDYTAKMRPANDAFFQYCQANHRPNITIQGKSTAKYCRLEADWISLPQECGYTAEDQKEILGFVEEHRFALKCKKNPFQGFVGCRRYFGVEITRDIAPKLATKLWELSDHREKVVLCATREGTRDFLGSIPASFFGHHKQDGPSQDERQQGDILDILDEQHQENDMGALYAEQRS